MKNTPAVVLFLVTSSVPLAAETPQTPPVDAQVAAPSPSPSPSPALGPAERRRAERERAGAPRKPVAAPRDNHTQVNVVSVDTDAATLTFTDVEGEQSTWRFEPPALAGDQMLKPGARVTIIWKSDEKGQPIPTILGVVAFGPRATAPPSGGRRPATGERPRQHQGRPSALPPSSSPSPSPPASPPPQ
jgi:hypothetical protein